MRRRWAPDPGAAINWEHPFSQKLVCLVPAWQVPVVDVVARRAFTNRGAPAWAATDAGPGVDMASSSQKGCYLDISATSDPLKLQPPLTVAWLGTQVGAPSQFGHLWGATYSNNDTSPYAGWALSRADPAGTYQIAFNSAGTLVTLAGTTSCDSTRGLVMVVATISSAGYDIWVRGARENSSATAVTTINYTTPELLLGTWSTVASRGFNVNHLLGYAWNRVLSAQEIVELWEDPLAVFQDASPAMFSTVTGTIVSAQTATGVGAAHFESDLSLSLTLEAIDAITVVGVANNVSKGANNDTPPVGVGTAYNAAPSITGSAFPAAATGAVVALNASSSVAPTGGAVGSGAANAATTTIAAEAVVGTSSVAAAANAAVSPTGNPATAAGTAGDPSVSTSAGTNVNAGSRTSAGTAHIPTVSVSTTIAASAAAGTAETPQTALSVHAEAANGSGTAYQPVQNTRPEHAAGSGAAYSAAVSVAPSLTVIPISGSVNSAAVAVAVNAAAATAAGAAAAANQTSEIAGQTVTVRDHGHTVTVKER